MPKLPPSITKALRALAGAAISIGLLWLFLKDVQLGEVANSLKMANALKNGYQQSQHYKSLNGGWVMATGASVLNFTLGGTAIYHGKTVISPTLGCGHSVVRQDIFRSVTLVNKAVIIFITLYFSYELINIFFAGSGNGDSH